MAIGVAKPMNVVYTEGSTGDPDEQIAALINEHFDPGPKALLQMLDLLRPDLFKNCGPWSLWSRKSLNLVGERTDRRRPFCAQAAGLS